MKFSADQLAALEAKAAAETAQEWPWSSSSSAMGQTFCWTDGMWCVALRVVPTPSRGPVVEQLRIFPVELLEPDKQKRAELDRAFWADEDEEWLAEHATYREATNGITTTLLRRFPWRQILGGPVQDVEDVLFVEGVGGDARNEPRRTAGGPDRGDLFYAQRAREYVNLVNAGDKSPVGTLTDTHGYSRATVAGWLKEARRRGLLESAGPGRPGGTLTSQAKAHLGVDPGEEGWD